MTTAIAKIEERTITEIEEACQRCSLAKLQLLSPIRRTLELAAGMQVIRKHLTGPLMQDIHALSNTKLGFLTDKKEGKGYDDDTIRDVVIEGMLRGASIIGNEFNIIAGTCYLTRQYFERQLREWPGLTELRVVEGVPTTAMAAGGALVPMRASWKLNGQPDQLCCDHTSDGDYRIPVRVNAGMGADAILGKAKRKLFAKIFARITGSNWVSEQADMDAGTIDVEVVTTATEKPEVRTPGEQLFRNIEPILAGLEQLTDVDQYQASAAALLKDEDDLSKLSEWCEWRRQAIRDGRGQRANGKE